jgi:hypothetical protein
MLQHKYNFLHGNKLNRLTANKPDQPDNDSVQLKDEQNVPWVESWVKESFR